MYYVNTAEFNAKNLHIYIYVRSVPPARTGTYVLFFVNLLQHYRLYLRARANAMAAFRASHSSSYLPMVGRWNTTLCIANFLECCTL